MLLVKRPEEPAGFVDAVRDAEAALAGKVSRGERPSEKDFVDCWNPFKHHLLTAQGGRCAYCDVRIASSSPGDLDHYRPKGHLQDLSDDPKDWGVEIPGGTGIRNRRAHRISDLGYWWLAYAWENFVVACVVCNVSYKRALFPVALHPRCVPPRQGGDERPLLLHCYGAELPSKHLQFNADGSVEARNHSRHGFETIKTVGLDRTNLRADRRHIAEDTHSALQDLAHGIDSAASDLQKLGSRTFPGVVRAIVEQALELTWDEFLAAFCA